MGKPLPSPGGAPYLPVMTYIAWIARIIVFAVIAGVFHYNLPDRDIVRIVNTEVRRVDFGANSIFWQNSGVGDAVSSINRDIAFIETDQHNGINALGLEIV